MKRFSSSELDVVQRWLQAEGKILHDARMVIECGDDFAMTNDKWPRAQELLAEQTAIKRWRNRALEQADKAVTMEGLINERNSTG
tara:strand:+ start:252 stop:506 length:255 start_codon:yes stop_codon:yes gene_type:complete